MLGWRWCTSSPRRRRLLAYSSYMRRRRVHIHRPFVLLEALTLRSNRRCTAAVRSVGRVSGERRRSSRDTQTVHRSCLPEDGPIEETTRAVLRQAWTGEPFEYRGMSVVVRPTPVQPNGPPLYIGGSSEASALRAARMGDGYVPATDGLYEVYADERRRLGLDVPPPPPQHGPLFLFVTDDPERAWNHVGPTCSTPPTRTPNGPKSAASGQPLTHPHNQSTTSNQATPSPSSHQTNVSTSPSPWVTMPSSGSNR